MEWMSNPESWIALLTLTVLEIVLGIDNIIFISILASKLPQEQQAKARSGYGQIRARERRDHVTPRARAARRSGR